MENIVVLTGAGMSAESGINTFRDIDGLWEGHDIMEVASPQGWQKDQNLVLDFYNKRRRQLLEVSPNSAHKQLADLETKHHVSIITQNVDDLHERAGSTNVIHLHGELCKVRSQIDTHDIREWKKDLIIGDLCKHGQQLRPHIVWFGEEVPMMEQAIKTTQQATILIIIGTSMQVYPAAGLSSYAPDTAPVYYIDPKPANTSQKNLIVLKEKATSGVAKLLKTL